eukprot:15112299-Alexandrium_andersonii.AAC.1
MLWPDLRCDMQGKPGVATVLISFYGVASEGLDPCNRELHEALFDFARGLGRNGWLVGGDWNLQPRQMLASVNPA